MRVHQKGMYDWCPSHKELDLSYIGFAGKGIKKHLIWQFLNNRGVGTEKRKKGNVTFCRKPGDNSGESFGEGYQRKKKN